MSTDHRLATEDWLDLSNAYEPDCMNWQAPVVWDHALGAEIWDIEGRHYYDWTSGVLVANVGHAHPRLAEAISRQAARLLNTFDFPTPERISLAKKIVETTPPNLDKVIFLTTGAEAMDASIRLARRFSRKYEILSFWGGFHGRSYGPMSVSGIGKIRKDFGPFMPGAIMAPYPYCYRCPFEKEHPDCDLFCLRFLDRVVETASSDGLAGLIVEPYQGTAGFVFPPQGYLKKLEQWARKRNVLFILDEVQSSFGRTGKMWALEHEDIVPDVLCLGKGIGSGAPIAAVVSTSEITSSLSTGEMSSTLGGNPLSCAAALAVFDIIEGENLVAKAAADGEYLRERFHDLMARHAFIGDVRGMGLVFGLEFVKDKKTKVPAPEIARKVILRSVSSGLMCGKLGLHGNVIRVAPPLVMPREQLAASLDIFAKVLEQV